MSDIQRKMKIKFLMLISAALMIGACNSSPVTEGTKDSSMTDSATIGIDTNATGVTDPVPVSDSANTGLRKAPGDLQEKH